MLTHIYEPWVPGIAIQMQKETNFVIVSPQDLQHSFINSLKVRMDY